MRIGRIGASGRVRAPSAVDGDSGTP